MCGVLKRAPVPKSMEHGEVLLCVFKSHSPEMMCKYVFVLICFLAPPLTQVELPLQVRIGQVSLVLVCRLFFRVMFIYCFFSPTLAKLMSLMSISEKRRIGGVAVHLQPKCAEGAEEKLRGDAEPRVRRSGSVLRSFLSTCNVIFWQTISPFRASDFICNFYFTPSHLDFLVQRRKHAPTMSNLCHVWIEASCRTAGWLLWVKGGAALALEH